MIPAMTTGTMHFIMRSGRRTPIAAIPTPDLEVPYEAPMPGGDGTGQGRGEARKVSRHRRSSVCGLRLSARFRPEDRSGAARRGAREGARTGEDDGGGAALERCTSAPPFDAYRAGIGRGGGTDHGTEEGRVDGARLGEFAVVGSASGRRRRRRTIGTWWEIEVECKS